MDTSPDRESSVGLGTLPVREGRSGLPWFREHFDEAADAILEFLGGDHIELSGKRVADVGAGDGIIDLALALKGRPEQLVGFDIVDTDVGALRKLAKRAGVSGPLPDNLEFCRSDPRRIPAGDGSFDIVVSWSTF